MIYNHPIGPIMIDVEGLTLSAEEKEKINHPNTGAVILFTRNFANPMQITQLINSIRAARNGDILIAVDQEGGRVQRFQKGFTRLPPAAFFSTKQLDGNKLAKTAGWIMAAELLAVGVDFSFAPVLDIDCGISTIIGDRSFSEDHQLATQLANSFRKGMHEAGMAAVGKHFPGHGAVALDSHLSLPVDDRNLDKIRCKDMQPFAALIEQGLEAIMPAHIIYPAVDTQPAGFSSIWIQKILRGELGFKGAVFSDDLSMEGAANAGNFVERAMLAQKAGCDMLLVCNNPQAAAQVLDAIPIQRHIKREKRLNKMRGKHKMNREQLLHSGKWLQLSKLLA
jgi:beta-N-acetylhexosaminidase